MDWNQCEYSKFYKLNWRKFTKWIEICVNIRNFTKWIEISVNIQNFTRWIEIIANIRNFTKWIEISLIIRIVRIEISLTIRNTVYVVNQVFNSVETDVWKNEDLTFCSLWVIFLRKNFCVVLLAQTNHAQAKLFYV